MQKKWSHAILARGTGEIPLVSTTNIAFIAVIYIHCYTSPTK